MDILLPLCVAILVTFLGVGALWMQLDTERTRRRTVEQEWRKAS